MKKPRGAVALEPWPVLNEEPAEHLEETWPPHEPWNTAVEGQVLISTPRQPKCDRGQCRELSAWSCPCGLVTYCTHWCQGQDRRAHVQRCAFARKARDALVVMDASRSVRLDAGTWGQIMTTMAKTLESIYRKDMERTAWRVLEATREQWARRLMTGALRPRRERVPPCGRRL